MKIVLPVPIMVTEILQSTEYVRLAFSNTAVMLLQVSAQRIPNHCKQLLRKILLPPKRTDVKCATRRKSLFTQRSPRGQRRDQDRDPDSVWVLKLCLPYGAGLYLSSIALEVSLSEKDSNIQQLQSQSKALQTQLIMMEAAHAADMESMTKQLADASGQLVAKEAHLK